MRTFFVCSTLATIALVAASASSKRSQDFKPGKLPKDQVDALRPGVTLTLLDAANKPLDVQHLRLFALYVPEGKPASVLVPPGPFNARITGLIKVSLRGDFAFRLEAKGKASLLINGKELLKVDNATATSEPIELAKYYNKVEVVFQSPKKGDAALRVFWKGEDFAWEPLPPHALFTPGNDAALLAHERIREGRHLFGRLECAHCHALPGKLKADVVALPELEHRAPLLANAGHRFQFDWIRHWLLDPQALRSEATMPRLLHGPDAQQQAVDLAAYLMTIREGKPLAPADLGKSAADRIDAGDKLFNTLGCMVCHRLDDPKREDKFGRLSLSHVAVKYAPGALEAFLRKPHENYAWSRMPDFKLTEAEIDNLAAFLKYPPDDKGERETLSKIDLKSDPERGKKLYEEIGCVRCHGLATKAALATPLVAAPSSVDKGCLADNAAARGKAPDFPLTAATRAALAAFLKSDATSLTREVPAEFARRQMDSLQCLACHRRDGLSSRWQRIREDEGEFPEVLPILTWAGEKLKPEWTQKLLRGEQPHGARPWLKTRMPAFPARADLISLGLSHEHGLAEKDLSAPPHDAKLAALGEKLLPQAGGFNCVMCHGIGAQKALAPFEAPGINLLDAAHRIRHAYYQRWMLDPPRLDPLTRMPKLAPDGKSTPLPLFDGDAARQFDTIWHYMQTLPGKK